MDFTRLDFSFTWQLLGWITTLAVLLRVLSTAAWHKLKGDSQAQHVFVGVTFILVLVWLAEVGGVLGLSFHLLLLTTVTMMFGFQFALLSGLLALLFKYLVVLFLLNEPEMIVNFGLEFMFLVLLPVWSSWALARLGYQMLAKNFFVFIFFNGFVVAFVGIVLSLFSLSLLYFWSGVYSVTMLDAKLLPFIPLLAFPEAFINTLLLALLVILKPQWISCFDDNTYLKGK